MSCRGGAAKTVAPDDPTVWERTPSVYPTLSLNQDRDAQRWSLQHWMNRHLGQGEASIYPTVVWKLTETILPRGIQHRMNRRTVNAMRRNSYVRELQRLRDVGGASDELMLLKSRRRFIRRSNFQWAVSQQLVECLRLFIPPPLTHLRWLDSVEVQRSSRHLEDHIQSIQVLNCSSLDLHMLCVCA
jgi:hypothetical protein